MRYQLDQRLAAFVENMWKPSTLVCDPDLQPVFISPTGMLLVTEEPIEGPETDQERFFTTIWNSAKPSRWFESRHFTSLVSVTRDGKLWGDIGFDFQFVRDPSSADGKTKFMIPWEMQ